MNISVDIHSNWYTQNRGAGRCANTPGSWRATSTKGAHMISVPTPAARATQLPPIPINPGPPTQPPGTGIVPPWLEPSEPVIELPIMPPGWGWPRTPAPSR